MEILSSSAVRYFAIQGLLLAAVLAGCGSQGARNGVVSANDEPAPGSFLQVRWFPVDTADVYVIYLEDTNGNVIHSEEALPTGCTQLAKDGFTSGLCNYQVKLPRPGETVNARVSASNRQGEGERSLRVVSTE